MILPQLIWAIKKLLGNDSTILSRDNGERDIAVRISWWRNQLIHDRLRENGLSYLQQEWMQPLFMRKTTYAKLHPLMSPTCHIKPGGFITQFNGAPLCRLYTANMENTIDAVKPVLYIPYSKKCVEHGGYVCTSNQGSELTISPSVDVVNGGVVVSDPLQFLIDTETGVRPFDMYQDEYPVDGELAVAIVLEICKEFGIRKELGPEHVKFNPTDSMQV